MRAVVTLAGLLHRDQWRRKAFRRGLLASVLGSLVLVALIGGLGAVVGGRSERTDRHAVATSADLDEVTALFAGAGLDVAAAPDPAAVLAAGDAHLAVTLVDGAPTLTYDPTREASLEAFGRAHAAITPDSQAQRLVVDDLPAPRRYEGAQFLSLIAGILLATAATSFSSALAAGKAGSPAEAVLATPIGRRAIGVAVAAGAAPTTALQIGGFLGVGIAGVVATAGAAGLDVASVVATCAAATVGLTAVGCALAALAAGFARSQAQGGAVTGALTLVVTVLSFIAIAKPDLSSAGPAAWVPVLGPALAIRDAMYGSVAASTLAALIGTALAVVIVGTAVSGHFFAADGRARRT